MIFSPIYTVKSRHAQHRPRKRVGEKKCAPEPFRHCLSLRSIKRTSLTCVCVCALTATGCFMAPIQRTSRMHLLGYIIKYSRRQQVAPTNSPFDSNNQTLSMKIRAHKTLKCRKKVASQRKLYNKSHEIRDRYGRYGRCRGKNFDHSLPHTFLSSLHPFESRNKKNPECEPEIES